MSVIKVLFVCTGNICRSPTAEGVFRKLANDAGVGERFHVGSAGTDGYHEGAKPDPRAIKIAKAHGVSIETLRARRLVNQDYFDFDYMYAMDGGHFYELQNRAPENRKAEIRMFLETASHLKETEVPDPWYGDEKDFQHVYGLIYEGAGTLLAQLIDENRLNDNIIDNDSTKDNAS